MSIIDSEDSFITTYSQDERIENALREVHLKEKERKQRLVEERKIMFEEIFENKTDNIFDLKGLTIIKYTSSKIKFKFVPSEVVQYVCYKVRFICSLKYIEKCEAWFVKNDSFPVNIKEKIYSLFYDERRFIIDDYSLPWVITKIHSMLVLWSKKHQEYRLKKFERYKNGEDVYLDSDDEILFLTKEEQQERHRKKMALLKRMIPPKSKLRRQRQGPEAERRREPRHESDSDV